MIKEFIKAWNKNKNDLENYFRNTKQNEYYEYSEIVKKLFEIVINPYIEKNMKEEYPYWGKGFDVKKMTIIDDGDYQGTQIFIIPLDVYQPNIEKYVYTNTYYGSCSGCDTLIGIHQYYASLLPDENQIAQYMALALHLLQKCKFMEDMDEDGRY